MRWLLEVNSVQVWPGNWFAVALLVAVCGMLAAVVAWLMVPVVVGRDADLSERINVDRMRIHAVRVAGVAGVVVGGWFPAPVIFAVVTGVWVAGSLIDVATKRLPDMVTFSAAAVLVVGFFPHAILGGEAGWRPYLAGLATVVVFFVLAWMMPSGFGLGDVKLGASTGMALGWFGWMPVVWGALAAFVGLSVVGIVVARLRGCSTRHVKLPFGPFLVAGVLLGPLLAAVGV